jgi:hypothetical protein
LFERPAKKLLFGTMRHELFQETMRRKDFSYPTAQAIIRDIVRTSAESLLASGVSSLQAEAEILKFIPQLQRFAAEYTDIDKNQLKKRTVAQGVTLVDQVSKPSIKFLAKAVEAIEDPAISPELGLKGYIDMIFNAVTATSSSPPTMSLFGVELKTGHVQSTQMAHMAQLVLYILMMQARYGTKHSHLGSREAGQSGMLLYLNNESLSAVNMVPMISELKTLIGQRNLVAAELVRASRPRGVILSYDGEQGSMEKKIR